jgi:hypothetical protein
MSLYLGACTSDSPPVCKPCGDACCNILANNGPESSNVTTDASSTGNDYHDYPITEDDDCGTSWLRTVSNAGFSYTLMSDFVPDAVCAKVNLAPGTGCGSDDISALSVSISGQIVTVSTTGDITLSSSLSGQNAVGLRIIITGTYLGDPGYYAFVDVYWTDYLGDSYDGVYGYIYTCVYCPTYEEAYQAGYDAGYACGESVPPTGCGQSVIDGYEAGYADGWADGEC